MQPKDNTWTTNEKDTCRTQTSKVSISNTGARLLLKQIQSVSQKNGSVVSEIVVNSSVSASDAMPFCPKSTAQHVNEVQLPSARNYSHRAHTVGISLLQKPSKVAQSCQRQQVEVRERTIAGTSIPNVKTPPEPTPVAARPSIFRTLKKRNLADAQTSSVPQVEEIMPAPVPNISLARRDTVPPKPALSPQKSVRKERVVFAAGTPPQKGKRSSRTSIYPSSLRNTSLSVLHLNDPKRLFSPEMTCAHFQTVDLLGDDYDSVDIPSPQTSMISPRPTTRETDVPESPSVARDAVVHQ
ncbi:sortase [Perkinsela sp. CCAP 1560/4]|nr:sortase [Perkinsela sp. CCAP 1560/4]|eukprot:KNH08734.1 sortase [Perkinsela sp. CCAP 1560/4]